MQHWARSQENPLTFLVLQRGSPASGLSHGPWACRKLYHRSERMVSPSWLQSYAFSTRCLKSLHIPPSALFTASRADEWPRCPGLGPSLEFFHHQNKHFGVTLCVTWWRSSHRHPSCHRLRMCFGNEKTAGSWVVNTEIMQPNGS